ncbi:MAG TPA: hypothetical protein VGJ17_02540, partial [Candidatus Limnocylindrales bacterium]
ICLVATLLVALAACSSPTPSGASTGALTDPKAILAKSLTALNDAKTFHLTGSLSGTLEADLTNSGTDSAIDLKGTALTADADVPNERASLSISVPALFALKVDYLQIGPDTYSRNSLSGPDWTHTSVAADASSAPSAIPTPRRIGSASPSPVAAPSSSPEGSLDLVGQITAGLDNLPNPPTVGPAATCGTKSCYTIEISVPLNGGDATGLGLPLPSGAAASVTVTLSIEQDTLLPVHAVAVINAGSNGTFNLELSLSKFNAPVSISAPPAGQVVEESPGP